MHNVHPSDGLPVEARGLSVSFDNAGIGTSFLHMPQE